MKINDFIFKYKELNNSYSLCRVRTFIGKNNKIVNLITDLEELNITKRDLMSSIDFACMSLIENGMTSKNAIFIEHKEADKLEYHKFDIVKISDQGNHKWERINLEDVKKLLDCSDDELNNITKLNNELVSKIEQLKYAINPEKDFFMLESQEIIKRRLEIRENMISKHDLENLIKNKAIEQDISGLLKKDLSIFGDVYSSPKDEYICFKEYIINDRKIDYVVLTGRSKLTIYLIEVKGAEFNLVNKNGKLNEKINEADTQISKTLGYIIRNYSRFKEDIYEMIRLVERGDNKYDPFRGPIYKLRVSSEKDIYVHGVIIGGTTVDDIAESKIRYDYEYKNGFKVKLESWNTFIRKINNR